MPDPTPNTSTLSLPSHLPLHSPHAHGHGPVRSCTSLPLLHPWLLRLVCHRLRLSGLRSCRRRPPSLRRSSRIYHLPPPSLPRIPHPLPHPTTPPTTLPNPNLNPNLPPHLLRTPPPHHTERTTPPNPPLHGAPPSPTRPTKPSAHSSQVCACIARGRMP
ncbi:hypothetical protein B0H34DRAFT_716985 [Crassisporium funariophilum]|nr:hypothetical protein B0H34DRAFT_716985 [Crassisporium funariophilum]